MKGSTLEKKQDMLGWTLSLVMGQGLKVSNMKASPWDLATWTKYVVCAKCGQAWGWRERLWKELMDWEKIQNSKRGFFNNVKRYIGF